MAACLFCNSTAHFSHNCNIYISDESREKLLKSKNYCTVCLNYNDPSHTFAFCEYRQRCYTCFSKRHHAAFCPERFTNVKLFLPKIDQNLHHRFFDCFDPLEQLNLALSSGRKNEKLIESKDYVNYIRIWDQILEHYKNTSTKNYVVFSEAEFDRVNFVAENRKILKNVIFNTAKNIKILSCKLESEDFLKLLSRRTKELYCNGLQLTSRLNFSEILEKCPNIEKLQIYGSDVEVDKTWADEILKYTRENILKEIGLTLFHSDINAENLAALFKNKGTKNFKMTLNHRFSENPQYHLKFCETMKKQLSSHFKEIPVFVSTLPCLVIVQHPPCCNYDVVMTLNDSDTL